MPVTVGIPRELKKDEDRVAIAPSGVHALHEDGQQLILGTVLLFMTVLVERLRALPDDKYKDVQK